MKLGIIGSGMIVQDFLTITPILPEIELTAILGRKQSSEKINNLVNKYHIQKAYYDYEKLLNDHDIDTVYIALPNHLHFQYAKKALECHKHVICEKPFTTNLKQLDQLIDLATNNNCLLFEAITNQYLPVYQQIKEQLSTIGKISIVSCNFSQYSSRYDDFKQGIIHPVFDFNKAGGALMDLNVYNIHFITGLFGQPNQVTYHANIENNIDTSGILFLDYSDFKVVCIGAKDSSAPITSTIQGNLGCIKIDGPVSVLNNIQILKNKGHSKQIPTENHHHLFDEFKTFAQAIDHLDYNLANKMLQHSRIVMDVLTKAQKSANLNFDSSTSNN